MRGLARTLGLCVALAACAPAAPATSPRATAVAARPAAVRETPDATHAASVTASGRPPSVGVVAYEQDDAIWVVNADGTDARRLLPDEQGRQHPVAWSRDGSTLLFSRDVPTGIGLTDASGSQPELIDLPCPLDPADDPLLAACQPDLDSIAISPDGSKLAYAIWHGSHDQSQRDVTSVIVVLDRSAGSVTRLESTRVKDRHADCETDVARRSVQWSPDGARLLIVPDPGCALPSHTVRVDGTELLEVEPARQDTQPAWAPDGSLVFIPPGSSLTRDGRVVALRFADFYRGDLWISDADGGNATTLSPTVPALTAAGCVVCPYPVYPDGNSAGIDPLVVRRTPPFERFWITSLLWQPAAGGTP